MGEGEEWSPPEVKDFGPPNLEGEVQRFSPQDLRLLDERELEQALRDRMRAKIVDPYQIDSHFWKDYDNGGREKLSLGDRLLWDTIRTFLPPSVPSHVYIFDDGSTLLLDGGGPANDAALAQGMALLPGFLKVAPKAVVRSGPANSSIEVRPAKPVAGECAAPEKAATPAAAGFKQGTFSIKNWSGYPEGIRRPKGPFRLLEGKEYEEARRAADRANAALRRADPAKYAGKQIHEIHPVKFGGSPTDPANKIALTPQEHARYTSWWSRFMRVGQ